MSALAPQHAVREEMDDEFCGLSPAAILAGHDRGETIRNVTIEWFARRGVPVADLVKDYAGRYRFIHRDSVVWQDGGCWFEFARYRPEYEAEPALTVVAYNRLGDAADIVAWDAAGRFGSWLGQVGLLGEDDLGGFRLDPHGALQVHETPLDWLRARRRGVVVLDPHRAGPMLRDASPLLAQSIGHGRRLREMVAAPPVAILVADHAEAAT